MFVAAVDGFGGTVAGVGVVEVGQDVSGSAFERSSQCDEFGQAFRYARRGQRVDFGLHQSLARARIGRAVGINDGSSPVEWCNRFVSFGLGYALSWSGVSSCPVGWGVSRDLVRMSRLR